MIHGTRWLTSSRARVVGADEPKHHLLSRGADRTGDVADALNKRILEDVQLSGAGFLSGTTLGRRFWIRACIVNPLATISDVDAVFNAVRAALARQLRMTMWIVE
jgi:hypothetical protein